MTRRILPDHGNMLGAGAVTAAVAAGTSAALAIPAADATSSAVREPRRMSRLLDHSVT